MALPIGTRVRVLPPFDESFVGEYTTAPISKEQVEAMALDGVEVAATSNWLDGVPGAFDDKYLEVI